MPARRIITGQKVDQAKAQRARELRRHMTEEEAILWQHLRGNRFHALHFRRQQVIDRFIVDFYCHAVGVVVEIDGGIHKRQAAYDAERDQILSALGLRVLRVLAEDVKSNISSVLVRIAAFAGLEPNPPAPFP